MREGLRRLLDAPLDPLGTAVEWVVAYVKPSTVDHASKGPGKVGARSRPIEVACCVASAA